MAARTSPRQRKTVGRVLHEYKHGELKRSRGGRGGKVKSRRQAIAVALSEAGASLNDVVRTRIYVTDRTHAPEVMRAHGEAFGSARPACTGVVCDLLDERWLCELEVEAVLR